MAIKASTQTVSMPSAEDERLQALRHYEVLDTPVEQQFDDLVRLAGEICDTPVSLISLVDLDRQWFKAKVGIDAEQTPREIAACHYAIQNPDVMVVPDTLNDDRFKTNPLVTGDPHMRFYAGAPLTTPGGQRIGTICVLDIKPKTLSDQQKNALKTLANQVITLLELRLALRERDKREKLLLETQQAQTEAAERIGLALDSGTIVGTWVWDILEDRVTGDDRFATTFALDLAQLRKGVKLADAVQSIHPDDQAQVDGLIKQALAQGGRFRAHYRVPVNGNNQANDWLWVEANGRVELDADGRAVRFPGVLIDIDERRHAELSLEQSQQRYKDLFNSIDEGFCVIDVLFEDGRATDWIFREVNPAFEAQAGYTALVDKRASEAVPNLEPFWFETYGRVATTGIAERFVSYARQLDRWYDVYAFRVGRAEDQRIAILFKDISDRKRAETMIAEAQAHLSLMVESADEHAIISTDTDGLITSWNAGAVRLFGYTPTEAIGRSAAFIFTPEDRAAGAVEHEMDGAATHDRANDERWHLRKTGERFYASGIMSAMRDENGALKGFIKIARDMTRQRQAQEALIEARNAAEAANIAKTEFLANMSHEIRTPMNAVLGLSNLLANTAPLTVRQKEFIKTLQLSADSLLSLINDLLDISKIEARTVELEHIPFSVAQLAQEVVSMMATRVGEKGLSFTSDGECVKDRLFMGDPTRLRQIVLNLCSNAVKFTERGSVHVSITCEPAGQSGEEIICIAVTDTGIGIAADKIETIFQKFMQADNSINRKYGGTGLGLAITKTLTTIMGGTIAVESKLGKGSTFKVRVPLKLASGKEALADQSITAAPPVARPTVKPKVLLVEDYHANVIVATAFLEDFGYEIEAVVNGLDAFEKCKANRYAAVLMDVQMHGMNGFEATKLIREHEAKSGLPRLTIIGMTAHALSGDRERCIAAGMDDYIPKPFNPDELQQKLAIACDLQNKLAV